MTNSREKYRSDAFHSAHSAMIGLHKIGAIGKETMREFDVECLTIVDPLDANDIRHIRETARMSQNVFARVLNVSLSAVVKWELGDKKPSGPSLKLLTLAKNKGVDAIL